jgi:DNA repair exonuclease SbcCD nuclease subunit
LTRFVLITDTHLDPAGEEPEGYHQQPRYVRQLPVLLAALDAWILDRSGTPLAIDFIVHLGDAVDRATSTAVCAAAETYRLSVPVYLCLGNHDMAIGADPTKPASALWIDQAPELFYGKQPTSTIRAADCVIHIVPTQWCDTPFYWAEEQRPHFLPEQRAHLEDELARRPDLPHVLCTHGEVFGVPTAQTGFEKPLHPPLQAYTRALTGLARGHPHLRAIFSGHNHINTCQLRAGTHFVTSSALTETPFEFKVVAATQSHLSMATVPLLPKVGLCADYDWDRTWVQGRHRDRAFTIAL